VTNPLDLLQKMQQQSLAGMPALPEEEKFTELWSGVGFRLGDMHLVAPLEQVSEVLHCPDYTMVPGTRSWLKGVANVRGNLVTIVDLPEFFGKKTVLLNENSRLLVMNVEGLNTALLVDEVFGLRHFDEQEERQEIAGMDDPAGAYLSSAFFKDNVLWGVFDMKALAKSASFLHVAA
jgi:twitching motility protein PilI